MLTELSCPANSPLQALLELEDEKKTAYQALYLHWAEPHQNFLFKPDLMDFVNESND